MDQSAQHIMSDHFIPNFDDPNDKIAEIVVAHGLDTALIASNLIPPLSDYWLARAISLCVKAGRSVYTVVLPRATSIIDTTSILHDAIASGNDYNVRWVFDKLHPDPNAVHSSTSFVASHHVILCAPSLNGSLFLIFLNLLLRHHARFDIPDANGRTAISLVAQLPIGESSRVRILFYMLDSKIDIGTEGANMLRRSLDCLGKTSMYESIISLRVAVLPESEFPWPLQTTIDM
jgi:hypothetical protein